MDNTSSLFCALQEKPKVEQPEDADDLDVGGGGLVAGEGAPVPLLGMTPTETKAQTAAEAEMDRVTFLGLKFSCRLQFLPLVLRVGFL